MYVYHTWCIRLLPWSPWLDGNTSSSHKCCGPSLGCQVPVQRPRQRQVLGPSGLPQGVMERAVLEKILTAHWSGVAEAQSDLSSSCGTRGPGENSFTISYTNLIIRFLALLLSVFCTRFLNVTFPDFIYRKFTRMLGNIHRRRFRSLFLQPWCNPPWLTGIKAPTN